ncbi:unnamed protein product [Musa textilis]
MLPQRSPPPAAKRVAVTVAEMSSTRRTGCGTSARDLDHKSNSETMEWLLRLARPTCGVDRGMRRLVFLLHVVPHFYMLGRDLGHKTDCETLRWLLSWVLPQCLHGGGAPNSLAP